MGLRGPPSKPAELKILEGNAGNRPIKVGPKLARAVGDCPEGETPEVRAVWERLADEWQLLLSAQDRQAFLDYCRLRIEGDAAYAEYLKAGAYEDTPAGGRVPSAEFRRWRDLDEALSRRCKEFGATPSARSRVDPVEISVPESRRARLLT